MSRTTSRRRRRGTGWPRSPRRWSSPIPNWTGFSPARPKSSHRAAGAHWLRRFGIEAQAEDIVVTCGWQHGLVLALAAQTKPGEPVLTEELGFYGLKSAAALLGRTLVPLRMDRHGLMPDDLDAACRRNGARALVCAPGLHNPTTATLPLERRHEVLCVCERHGLQIIEDDVYGFLIDPPLPSFAALAPERATHVTSISKIVGPGWRLGRRPSTSGCAFAPAGRPMPLCRRRRGVGVAPGSLFEMGRLTEEEAVRICPNAAASAERLAEGLRILRDLAATEPPGPAGDDGMAPARRQGPSPPEPIRARSRRPGSRGSTSPSRCG